MTPTVSVVIPSLNQARFLGEALDSVLGQDYPSLQVIVMDGGSTDGSVEILKGYADRIQFVSEPDLGQSHAINKGVSLAKGQIVSWLNSDDRLVPGAIGKAVAALTATPGAAMLYGEGDLLGESGEVMGRFEATRPFDLWILIHVWDYILQPTVFMRAECFRAIGGLDESLHYGMDWDLWIRLGRRWPVVYLPEVLAQSREYRQTKTASGGWRRFRELRFILARHGAPGWSPGAVIYGLETLKREFPSFFGPCTPAEAQAHRRSLIPRLMRPLHHLVALLIRRRVLMAKGTWSDGWIGPAAHHALPWNGEAGCVRMTVEVVTRPRLFPFCLKIRVLEQTRRVSCRRAGFLDVSIPVLASVCPSRPLEVALHAWPSWPGRRYLRRRWCRLHKLQFEPASSSRRGNRFDTPPLAGHDRADIHEIDVGDFHSNHYLRLNNRRLEHLESLGLELSGRSVLELGAGIGDLSTFFLDRDCDLTSVEVRPGNLERLVTNIRDYYAFYPRSSRPSRYRTVPLDLDADPTPDLGTFEIVFCYGVLYHLRDPARLIRLMAATCTGLCLVETCVSVSSDDVVETVSEDASFASQAFHDVGCRPSRRWVFRKLVEAFPHVYVPRTQPSHEEFPLDWSLDPADGTLTRAVFVASREPLANPLLLDSLPAKQTRS